MDYERIIHVYITACVLVSIFLVFKSKELALQGAIIRAVLFICFSPVIVFCVAVFTPFRAAYTLHVVWKGIENKLRGRDIFSELRR